MKTGRRKLRRNEGYVYVIGTPGEPVIKVGKTVDVEQRLKQLERFTSESLFIFYVSRCVDNAASVERRVHCLLRRQRRSGEWFYCPPWYAALVVSRAVSFERKQESYAKHNNYWFDVERLRSLEAQCAQLRRSLAIPKPRFRVRAGSIAA